MVPEAIRRRVAKATVQTFTGGQGALVPGGYVLTATHCLSWEGKGVEALVTDYQDPVFEKLLTRAGRRLKARVLAVDPVSDLAVLGCPDPDKHPRRADVFDTFARCTDPVPVSDHVPKDGESMPGHILLHTGAWVAATVTKNGEADGSLWFHANEVIPKGTSGGPIVGDDGRLVGVVSWCEPCSRAGTWHGSFPWVGQALPRWLWERIEAAQGISIA